MKLDKLSLDKPIENKSVDYSITSTSELNILSPYLIGSGYNTLNWVAGNA